LDPATADVVLVKIGYLEPQLYELAAGWKLGLTPGGVDQDLLRLGHHRLQPGVFPFDTSVQDPDLTPVVTRR
ncbi:MAG TPA: MlrC C-terminal domain-containing protein, partial [Microlunatus sp.]